MIPATSCFIGTNQCLGLCMCHACIFGQYMLCVLFVVTYFSELTVKSKNQWLDSFSIILIIW